MNKANKSRLKPSGQAWKPVDGQWVIARTDVMVQTSPVDVYVILEVPSLYIHAYELVEGDEMTAAAASAFLKKGYKGNRAWPPRVTVAKGDPRGAVIAELARSFSIAVDEVPMADINAYAAPFLKDFAQHGLGASPLIDDTVSHHDRESARAMIPDSYDPCPCASGVKFKFCCKKIFREIIEAMVAAEDGHYPEALRWMRAAEKINGLSAEVLCRYAVVYSFFDQGEYETYLHRCLEKNPRHPRAHYMMGLTLVQQGKLDAAIDEYQQAIENYPKKDRFHLNETWNNLGTAYHAGRNFAKAKEAWETAVMSLPSDQVAVRNLVEFIYENEQLPESVRVPSPVVMQTLQRRG